MPSISWNFTSIISISVVCTVRPMKRASMGSSRWPRSISTSNCTRAGRPWSNSASSAARMVRPVYSTSSIRMMSLPATLNGISVALTTGFTPTVLRSSRYRLISRMPTGTLRFSRLSIFAESRWASGTPRRRMPIKASWSRSFVFSRISCASRTRVRSISEALMSWDFSRVFAIILRMSGYHGDGTASPHAAETNRRLATLSLPDLGDRNLLWPYGLGR